MKKTRVTEGGLVYSVWIGKDSITKVRGGNAEDITEQVQKIARLSSLNTLPPLDGNDCVLFGVLYTKGCESILGREADDEGFIKSLGIWRDVYIRFESNKLIEKKMKSVRQKLRRKRSAFAAAQLVHLVGDVA